MIIDNGVLVGSEVFDNYDIQTLSDSQWRILISAGAYIGLYGRIDNLDHAAFTMRLHPDYLKKMLDALVMEGMLANKEGYFYFPESLCKYVEVLR